MILRHPRNFLNTSTFKRFTDWRSYIQGNVLVKGIREYFYYIDHNGMLFLDDARIKNFTSCYKDKTFLKFFFSRIRINETGCHEDFPYISPCGRERNYIRCDDLPIVFTHLIYKDANPYLTYGLAGDDLCVKFNPNELTMYPDSGRVYHPGLEDLNGVGLVCSNLAIEFSKYFEFENGEESLPTHFRWNDEKIILQNTVLLLLEELKRRGRS